MEVTTKMSSILSGHPRTLVTGSRHRIGATVTDALVAAGARTAPNEAAPFADPAAAAAGAWDLDAVKALVDRVATSLGGLDLLVINTPPPSIVGDQTWEEVTDKEWDTPFALGPRLTYLLVTAALPYLRRSGDGRVVVTTSTVAWTGSPERPNHGAASSSLLGLVRATAREIGPEDVRINVVAYDPDGDDDTIDLVETRCLRRPTAPGLIADAVTLAASSLSRFITGQTILADGGAHFL
ncbi:SDR family oxidoreductase [Streptomyces sp. NPDC005708]|uniref:SDR family NAD(P)-dependent oxidoreductase n=1 Tax=Streptomyces sp. NPDC005708 TaxID=3154564 RepID=UPI0033DE99E2